MTWFNGTNFYTLTAATKKEDEVYFTRIGANDPNFNLRRDPGILFHRNASTTTFTQVYEMHGSYNASTEIPQNPFSLVKAVKPLLESAEYTVIEIYLESGESYVFSINNDSADQQKKHSIEISGVPMNWTGPYHFYKKQKN